MRSMLVIGLGRFGESLALGLSELGNEVMAVDINESKIDKIAPFVTSALKGDCMDSEVLESLGVRNFDVCFVCIGTDIQSALEITSQLKDLGAKKVVSKSDRDLHAKFLLKIGADEIIFPEKDMARRAAMRYTVGNAINYFELTKEYAIIEAQVPGKWIGKTIRELDIRAKYRMNIIGFRKGETIEPIVDAGYVFNGQEYLVVAGSRKDSLKLFGAD